MKIELRKFYRFAIAAETCLVMQSIKLTMNKELKLAIFDLGQVCIRTHLERCYLDWEDMAGIRPGSVSRDFPFDDQYEDYERGTISGRSYAEYFCMVNGLALDFEQWKSGWNAIYGTPIEPTMQTAREMREAGVTVVAMSNTNATHTEYLQNNYKDLVDSFDHRYFSNEIGMRKPEPRVFEFILDQRQCDPSEVVFFDDLEENIYAAQRLGIESVLFDDDSKAMLWWKRRQAAACESAAVN